MNVLHVGKFYHPHAGGIETVCRGVAEGLSARADVSVKVLVYNDAARTVADRVGGVPVRRLGSLGTLASQPVCPSMPYWLAREAADVVNVHLPNPLAGLCCLLAGGDRPLVVSYHADITRQKCLMAPALLLLSHVLRRAARIVVATPNHVRCSRILPRYAGKCVVIPYGIDLAGLDLTPRVRARRDAIRAGDPRPVVLFVGRLVHYKGLEHLIRAMASVDARCVVIGDGPLSGGLEALAESLGLARRVTFLGPVGEREKVAHLHACDLLALPSVTPAEAFGMCQIEAMACSKPVISTDLPSGVPYVNRHGVTGLVVRPADSGALAGAINALLGDAALRTKLGAAGRRRAEAEYTVERMERRYYDLYREVLDHPERRRASRPAAAAAA